MDRIINAVTGCWRSWHAMHDAYRPKIDSRIMWIYYRLSVNISFESRHFSFFLFLCPLQTPWAHFKMNIWIINNVYHWWQWQSPGLFLPWPWVSTDDNDLNEWKSLNGHVKQFPKESVSWTTQVFYTSNK